MDENGEHCYKKQSQAALSAGVRTPFVRDNKIVVIVFKGTNPHGYEVMEIEDRITPEPFRTTDTRKRPADAATITEAVSVPCKKWTAHRQILTKFFPCG